jgi:catechol 2,3-dioxygenase-like lactoylglutathione lyase family enzyme
MPKKPTARPARPATSKKRPAKAAPARPSFLSVAVVVSDRSKAVEWYTEKFGLDHLDDEDHWQTVGLKGAGGRLHLCQVSEFDDKAALEPGNSGIAFTLTGDFVAACQVLMDRGVEFATPPTKYEWGWGASVKDPDGNELFLAPAP